MLNEILKIEGLSKRYPMRTGWFGERKYVCAVDSVSFSVERGEMVGLVGESGSGKTTLGRAVLRLIEPTEGKITFEGKDITTASHREMRSIRRRMQIVFQDPYASLDPKRSVGMQIYDAFSIHGLHLRSERKEKALHLLERVGLSANQFDRFPHEFSGGQRQRIGIARALALEPSLIVADEAVSALDVSVQAQVINLLLDLQRDLDLTMLFITHDLGLVECICDRVLVMYMGRIVEGGTVEEIYNSPAHPYTCALLAAVPTPDPSRRDAVEPPLRGDLPSPISLPSGCSFRTRCAFAKEECEKKVPPLRQLENGHEVACFYAEEIRAQTGRIRNSSPGAAKQNAVTDT
jgi:oligopeptide/dipeptide ABC transporter ATP-binding protein